MQSWTPSKKDQKQYPHFDAPLSLAELKRLVNDPKRVAQNSFLPFLLYTETYTPFRPNGKDKKERPIRYASHRDAAIYARYRHALSIHYEQLLVDRQISECVLAYRHIPTKPGSKTGKCNIDHAKEAFDHIEEFDQCNAIVLDISSYFENLDHKRLKEVWCTLLGVKSLPADHAAVFKAITKYHVVDCKKAYEVLGYFGTKPSGLPGYLIPKREMRKQLCSFEDFRNKICGKANDFDTLVTPNDNDFGIPQGAPLSDLLANAYLIDFDVEMNKLAQSKGGYYRRYSDDILFICPGDGSIAHSLMAHITSRISEYGEQISIKESKCQIEQFDLLDDGYMHTHIHPKTKFVNGKSTKVDSNGLNYLGFRFDGQRVYLKEQTLGNFHRKMAKAIKRETFGLVKRYLGQSFEYVNDRFDADYIIKKFGRVEKFSFKDDKRDWTFWTYVQRADQIFKGKSRIHGQVSRYKAQIRSRANSTLLRAHTKLNNPAL